jgi:Bacterial EndoU nuclease
MSVGGASAAGGAGASASSSASTGTSTTSSTTGTGANGATTSSGTPGGTTSGTTGTTTSGTTGTTAAAGTTSQTNAANGSTVNGQTDASNGPAATPNATALGQSPSLAAAQFNAAIQAAKNVAQTADKGEPGMRGIAPAAEQQAKALAQQQPKVQLAQIIAVPVPAAPPVAIPNTPAKKPASEAIANKIMNAVEGLFAPNEAPVTYKPLAAIPPEQHLEQQPLTPLPPVQQYPWADSFGPVEAARQQPAAPPVTPMTAAKVDGINGPIGFPVPPPPVQLPGTPAQETKPQIISTPIPEQAKPEAIGGGFQPHKADDTLPGFVTPDMPVDTTIVAAKPVSLPGWRDVNIDMGEIISGHTREGSRVKQGGERSQKDTFPDYMTERQIEQAVRQAYRNAESLGAQTGPDGVTRVHWRGTYDGLRIEGYVNKATKKIESAWPK